MEPGRTLALGLLNQVTNIPQSDVITLPTAGPSPGNANFASLYAKTFPQTSDFNFNLISTGDPVPFAWNLDQTKYPTRCIQYLFKIFGPVTMVMVKVYTALKTVQLRATTANKRGMFYAFLPGSGTVPAGPLPVDPATNMTEYLEDFKSRHVDDYVNYFQVTKEDPMPDVIIGFPFPLEGDQALEEVVAEEAKATAQA